MSARTTFTRRTERVQEPRSATTPTQGIPPTNDAADAALQPAAGPKPSDVGADWGGGAKMILAPSLKAAQIARRTIGVLYGDNDGERDLVIGLQLRVAEVQAEVKAGKLDFLESMLVAQACSLDAIFSRLAMMGTDQKERANLQVVMGLALRAQNGCRATIETLATIKNPPTLALFRQANFAGYQQVNNGQPAFPRVEGQANAPNKLLEALPDGSKRLEFGAPRKHAIDDPPVETLDVVHRPQDRRREGEGLEKRIQGRTAHIPAPALSRSPRVPRGGSALERTREAVTPKTDRGWRK